MVAQPAEAAIIATRPNAIDRVICPPSSRTGQEDGQAELADVGGPVALHVVHGGHVDPSRAEGGIGNGFERVPAVAHRGHEALLPFLDGMMAMPAKVMAIMRSTKSGVPERSS